MKKLLEITDRGFDKVIRFLGIRLKIKNRRASQNYHIINRLIQDNLSTAHLHQKTFAPYKNKHLGQDIVIFASGPSAEEYQPLKNAVHIGINRSFCTAKVPLDYIFIQDYTGKTPQYIADINNYNPATCTKFYGLIREDVYDKAWSIPEADVIKAKALRYKTDWTPFYEPHFALDIANKPLGDFGSTTFSALQFALWTHPRRIYLVGCDCSNAGYSYDKKTTNNLSTDKVIKAYRLFKQFAALHYPDIEIISINPIGLKGIFKDEYTK